MQKLLAIVLLTALAVAPTAAQDLGTDAQREAGKAVYDQKCAQCHGYDGDAASVAADYFRPMPRNFTTGIFKFRTTPNGELPTNDDLARSIREGMPYTGMPAWPKLSSAEVENLVYYIKTFNDFFSNPAFIPEPIDIPSAPSYSVESAELGRAVYESNQCSDCHGNQGRGDGPSAETLKDHWDQPIRPADLTKRWTYRNGQSRSDIYRTFTTGLDGSPMPSYDVPEDERWALVDYVWSLSRDEAEYGTHVVAAYHPEALDVAQGRALFEAATPAYFPIVGQVIEEGRAFYPGVNGIEVQALYNEDEIAFLLTWHDMGADRAGTNHPAMPAPAWGADTTGGTFSDAVALQFPAAPMSGPAKPYLLLGDKKTPAELWFADLGADAASVLVGRGSGDVQEAGGTLGYQASYEEGAWTVLFKRARVQEDGLSFEEAAFTPIAFSVWDGFNRERGNRRGISSWYSVYLEPMQQQSAALPMVKWVLITLLLEGAIILAIRRSARRKKQAIAA